MGGQETILRPEEVGQSPGRKYYLYRYLTTASDRDLEVCVPDGYRLGTFVPRFPYLLPQGVRKPVPRAFIYWWLMRTLGRLDDPRAFEVCTVHMGNVLAHYTVILPRTVRCEFMGRRDHEVGPLRTWEEHRRKGLAGCVLTWIKKKHADSGGYLWYVTGTENEPSIRLAERLGFERFAVGAKEEKRWPRLIAPFRVEAVIR